LEEIQEIKDPTQSDAVTVLARELQKALKRDRLLEFDSQGRVDVWAWNGAAQTPYKQNMSPDQAAVEMVVPLALDLLRLAPTSDSQARQLASTAIFESVANRTGLDNSQARRQFSKSFGARAGDVAMVEDALSYAIETKNYAAAMVAAEILGNIGDRRLLNSPGPMVRPLVQAVERGDRRSRFAAAEAIMKLTPIAPFAGSSDLMNALAFFADSPGVKRALVVFPNDITASNLAGMLRGLGYDVDIAINGRQANLLATSTGDYELALLSSRIDKPPVWVLIQQLRHDPRSAELPIGFMAEDADGDLDRMHILADSDPLAEAFGRPLTPEGMKFQIDRLVARGKNEVVPPDVRKHQALAALEWLKQLNHSSARDFDVRPYEAQLTRALHRAVTSTAAADVLAQMGTHSAVKSLAEMANMNTQPLAMRQAAAAGFSTAVGKYGIQLTTPEIKHQYDRYNQSALEDQSTQQLLGLMLDAIEASSKISHNSP
jgi:CheY-like chemotaxis protein